MRIYVILGIIICLAGSAFAQQISMNMSHVSKYRDVTDPEDSRYDLHAAALVEDQLFIGGYRWLELHTIYARFIHADLTRDWAIPEQELRETRYKIIYVLRKFGNYLYHDMSLPGAGEQLGKVDVSDPENPGETFISSDFVGSIQDITVASGHVYATTLAMAPISGGLAIYDDAADTPVWLSTMDITGFIRGIASDSTNLYVGNEADGLRIFDISVDPAAPVEVTLFPTPGSAYELEAADGFVYLASGDSGLTIIDVSSPSNPSVIARMPELGRQTNLDKSGNYIATVGSDSIVQIVDVSDPANPFLIGWHELTHKPRDVTMEGEYVLLPQGTKLSIFKFLPETSPLISFDNPVITQLCSNTSLFQTHTLTVSNPSQTTLDVTSVTASRDHIVLDTSAFELAAGSDLNISVTFHALAQTIETTDYLVFQHNGPTSPDTLRMDACKWPPRASISPDTLYFGRVDVGTSLTRDDISVYNGGQEYGSNLIGEYTVSDSSFTVTPTSFSICPYRCTNYPQVTFSPSAPGAVIAELIVTHNASATPKTIILTGLATTPGVDIVPSATSFGSVTLNDSVEMTVTLENTGANLVTISDISSDLTDFAVTPSSINIPAGSTREVTVSFAPSDSGFQQASLTFTTNLSGDQPVLVLNGTGVYPELAFAPETLGFENVPLGATGDTTVTISLALGTRITVADILSSDSALSISSRAFSIADSGSQEITVSFTPRSLDPLNAVLTFVTDLGSYFPEMNIDGTVVDNDKSNMEFVASHPISGRANGIAFENERVWVASNAGSLSAFEFQDSLQSLTQINVTGIAGSAQAIDIDDTLAVLALGSAGLAMYDLSQPEQPLLASSYEGDGFMYDLQVRGGYVYAAAGASGMEIINISVPATPVLSGSADTPGNTRGITIDGDHAYLADMDAGLRILDIANLSNPVEIGFLVSTDSSYDVAISGNYAYLADGRTGLRIIDVADPQQPVEVGSWDTPDNAVAVSLEGNLAYIADEAGGVRVIDVANVNAPAEVGFYDTPGSALDLVSNGDQVYVADGIYGVFILQYDTSVGISEERDELPEKFSLYPNYPNPFNPSTTIEYALPKQVQVSLIIYNALGEQIAILENSIRTAGHHRVVWHAIDQQGVAVGSGIYFYQLRAGSEVLTGKMILIR